MSCAPASFETQAVVPAGDMNHSDGPPPGIDDPPPCAPCDIGFSTGVESLATITFEDMFPQPGDADFNDMVMNFNIKESVNAQGNIEKITLDFVPKARGAGYDHKFILVMDGKKDSPSNVSAQTLPMFNGGATFKVTYFNSSGAVLRTVNGTDTSADLVVWPSTMKLFVNPDGSPVKHVNTDPAMPKLNPLETARVEIKLANPAANPGKAKVDIRKYRMMIHVIDTNYDIDLIDVNPAHIDSNGYPFGFVVPINWKYPVESAKIDDVYTYFTDYRNYLVNKAGNPNTPLPPDAVLKWYNTVRGGQESKIYSK
jgi:LruC domain-containing protein